METNDETRRYRQGQKFEPRECPNCGALFICTGDSDCWCLSVEIPEKVQDYIAARFVGCLCKRCIEKFIEKAQMEM